MANQISKEQLELVLKQVLEQQKQVLDLFQEILETELPDNTTRFELFCERLVGVAHEDKASKK